MVLLMRLLWVFGVICAGYYMYGPHGVVTSQYAGGHQVTRADQEKAACIERYERGQRKTKAGC